MFLCEDCLRNNYETEVEESGAGGALGIIGLSIAGGIVAGITGGMIAIPVGAILGGLIGGLSRKVCHECGVEENEKSLFSIMLMGEKGSYKSYMPESGIDKLESTRDEYPEDDVNYVYDSMQDKFVPAGECMSCQDIHGFSNDSETDSISNSDEEGDQTDMDDESQDGENGDDGADDSSDSGDAGESGDCGDAGDSGDGGGDE